MTESDCLKVCIGIFQVSITLQATTIPNTKKKFWDIFFREVTNQGDPSRMNPKSMGLGLKNWIKLKLTCMLCAKLLHSSLTLLTLWTIATRLLCPWDYPGRNTRMGYWITELSISIFLFGPSPGYQLADSNWNVLFYRSWSNQEKRHRYCHLEISIEKSSCPTHCPSIKSKVYFPADTVSGQYVVFAEQKKAFIDKQKVVHD